MPKRSIFNNIRLVSIIRSYIDLTKSNKAIIVAFDQEKVYDK